MTAQLSIPGVDQARRNADELWRRMATEVLEQVAASRDQFTADDLWDLLEPLGLDTHDHRAMGCVLRDASRRGVITKTNTTKPSSRSTRNGGDVRVWSSNTRIGANA